MTAYYNEKDPKAAQWLRNLIEAGHIATGIVDERSIEDVTPADLRGFTQCHFFAGIGVWSYALRRAGWRDDRPVWTGSCPCQPFSAAGKGNGFADERHLWPAWHWLISECRPSIIFGEQVASKDAEPWLDLVSLDLEAMGYTFGAIAFPSAGVGAPHIRDRTYFVAHADDPRSQGRRGVRERAAERVVGSSGLAGIVADTNGGQRDGFAVIRGIVADRKDAGRPQGRSESESRSAVRGLADAADIGRLGRRTSGASDGRDAARIKPERLCDAERLADADDAGLEGRLGMLERAIEFAARESGLVDSAPAAGPTNGFWRDADWLLCRDEKWRPVEPGTFPLVDGAPSRVGRLRAYGNAINAEAARIWIEASLEAAEEV